MSMGSIAARHARTVLEHVERILAIELLVAAQALDLRLRDAPTGRAPGAGVAEALRARPGARRATSTATASRGRTSRRRPRSSTAGPGDLAGWRRGPDRPQTGPDAAVDSGRWRIRILDVTDEAGLRPGPAVRGPGVRPPVLRLLGGRRPRFEGGASRLARRARAARAPAAAPPARSPANPFLADLEAATPAANPFATARPGEPVPDAGRRGRRPGRQPVRPGRPGPADGRPPTRRGSSSCSAAGSASSAATPRSCCSTTRPAAYAQFGPLTAYPRAQRTARALPGTARCAAAGGHHLHRDDRGRARRGLARALVAAVCDDLAGRGFAAVEAYPEVGARPDATSAATPGFWERPGSRWRSPTSGSRSCGASSCDSPEHPSRASLALAGPLPRAGHEQTAGMSARATPPTPPTPRTTPAGPRPVRAPRGAAAVLPRLGAGGGPPDADEQPRPGGRRGPRPPRRLRRDRSGGPLVGRVRRDRPRAAAPRPTTRRCSSSPASRSASCGPIRGRRGCSSPTRISSAGGRPGTSSASSSGKGLTMYGQMTAGLVDLHRDAGDPAGHVRDVRRGGPPAFRRDAPRDRDADRRASAGWAAPSRWR